MAKQTTVVSKSKPKVPVKKKKSGAAAVTTKTTIATTKVKSKTRGTVATKGKATLFKAKRGGSSSTVSNGGCNSKKVNTKAKKQTSVSTITSRTTLNSTSRSNAASSNNGTTALSSTARREVTRRCVENVPKTPVDRSTVSFPYDVRINGVSSMLSTIQKSTPKVKKVLLDECDIILECRYCKNLFRSMPNFLCHKQTYCKNMFDPSPETSSVQHLPHQSSSRDIEYNFNTAAITDQHQSNNSSSSSSQPVVDENACLLVSKEDNSTRSPLTFLSQIEQSSGERSREAATAAEENGDAAAKEKVCLVIEPLQGRKDGVVFQTRVDTSASNNIDIAACDSSASTSDRREVVDRDTAILGPDGRVMCTGTARGIEKIVKHLTAQIEITQNKMVRNSTNGFAGNCDICKTVFTSEKAFRQHKREAPDCVGQATCNKYNKIDNPDGHPHLGKETESTPFNNDELQEDQSTKTFVKKLFAPQSPFKSSEIVRSPLKSPLSAKMLLQSSSPKTSPYKKSLAKAVKQIRLPETVSPSSVGSSENSPHSSVNSFKPPQFFCKRCSRGFETTHEMSVHVAVCTRKFSFNETLDVAQGSAGRRKIGIEDRRHYFKTSPVPLNEHDYACPSSVLEESENQSFFMPNSVDESVRASNNKINVSNGTNGSQKSSSLETLDLDSSKSSMKSPDTDDSEVMSYSPTEKNDKGKENDNYRRVSNGVNTIGTNGSLSSSESEADRESSISNKTDSGISFSSTTAASESEGQEESQSVVTTELELFESSSNDASKNGKVVDETEVNLNTTSVISNLNQKGLGSVEKVLRPNSAVASLKRKSHRILSKSKTLGENGSFKVSVKKRK